MWSLIQSQLKSWSIIYADDNRPASKEADTRPASTGESKRPISGVAESNPTSSTDEKRPTSRDESNRSTSDNKPTSNTDESKPTSKIESNEPPPRTDSKPESQQISLKNETTRQTLIVNTPSFKDVNRGGQSMLGKAFKYLGKAGFKLTMSDEEYKDPYLLGEFHVNAASEIYYNVMSEYRLAKPARLGVFCDPRSLGMYMGVSDIFPDLTVSGKGGVMLTSHNLETALLTQYVKEYLHVTSAVSYSQESTEGNMFHCDAVMRYDDFLFGYAWLGKLVQSDTNSVAHEHQFSLGYTGVDYAVNCMTNLTVHKFMFYQVITAGLEQAFAITLNTSMAEVFTELGCRWKMTDDDSITVKIDSGNFLSVGLEKKLDAHVTIKLATNYATRDQGFNFGFGLEYEG